MARGDWPIDESITHGRSGIRGTAPDGHPRRCQARSKRTHEQCKQWALKTRDYCAWHGGRRPLAVGKYRQTREEAMNRYSRNAGPELRELIDSLAAGPAEDRLNLAEEIDAVRALTMQAWELWQAMEIVAETDSPDAERLTPAVRAGAQAEFRGQLRELSELILKQSKINASDEGLVRSEAIAYVVMQITKLAEQLRARFGDAPADLLVEGIKGIRLPSSNGHVLPKDVRYL